MTKQPNRVNVAENKDDCINERGSFRGRGSMRGRGRGLLNKPPPLMAHPLLPPMPMRRPLLPHHGFMGAPLLPGPGPRMRPSGMDHMGLLNPPSGLRFPRGGPRGRGLIPFPPRGRGGLMPHPFPMHGPPGPMFRPGGPPILPLPGPRMMGQPPFFRGRGRGRGNSHMRKTYPKTGKQKPKAPTSPSGELNKPWVTEVIKNEILKKHKLHQKAKKGNNKEDWEIFREHRNKVTTMLREAKCEYVGSHPDEDVDKIVSEASNEDSVNVETNDDAESNEGNHSTPPKLEDEAEPSEEGPEADIKPE